MNRRSGDAEAIEDATRGEGKSSTAREARGEIVIDAPADRVWRALTEADELKAWFPLEARVHPGADGRIWMSWGNEYSEELRIETWDPPRHLRTTWGWGEDGAQITDYWLDGRGGSTTVRVVTSGFPPESEWDDLVEGTRLGWLFELAQLRHYLEHHEGERRSAIFLRRRVALDRESAWARLMTETRGHLDAICRRVVDETPPWQFAAIVSDPPGGLLRLTVDPTHTDPAVRDVTVWLAGWGVDGATLDAAECVWARRLSDLFPDGEVIDTRS